MIRLDCRDPHLGRNLNNAVNNRAVIIIYCRVVVLVEKPCLNKLTYGLMCQIGVNRTGAISKKRSKMMHFSRLAALQNHSDRCSFLRPDKVLLQPGYGKQRRNRHMVLVHLAVAQNQDVSPFPYHTVHLYKKIFQRFFKTCIFIICDRDLRYLEAFYVHIFNFQKVCIGQDRVVNPEHLAIFFLLLQQISVPSDIDSR